MRRSVFPRELESAEVGRGFAGFRYKSRGKPSGRICLFCRPSAAAHEEKYYQKRSALAARPRSSASAPLLGRAQTRVHHAALARGRAIKTTARRLLPTLLWLLLVLKRSELAGSSHA